MTNFRYAICSLFLAILTSVLLGLFIGFLTHQYLHALPR